MSTRILFVCLGNICRSPSAQGVFAALSSHLDVVVDSAGTSGWHAGEAPYAPMQAAARARGYDLSAQRSRLFTASDFDGFDLIIGMDIANLRDIEDLRPAGNATPVVLFTDYVDGPADHVPDPYYTGDFNGALDLIEAASAGLIAQLAQ